MGHMGQMFQAASVFNQPLSFDTSKVTSMHFMFASARAFNQPLSFDTSKVGSMGGMFWYCSAFNQALSFDMSRVTNRNMFYGSCAFRNLFCGLPNIKRQQESYQNETQTRPRVKVTC